MTAADWSAPGGSRGSCVDRAAFLAKAGAAGTILSATPHAAEGRLLAGTGPVVAAFATFGLFWGSWAVMLFDIQHAFSLDDAQLGVLLAVAIAVAGCVERGHGAPRATASGRAGCCGSRCSPGRSSCACSR